MPKSGVLAHIPGGTLVKGSNHLSYQRSPVQTTTYGLYTSSPPLGHAVQSVMCLTADPGVASSILARSHTFVEIDHEIIFNAILLPSADSRRVVVSYKRK